MKKNLSDIDSGSIYELALLGKHYASRSVVEAIKNKLAESHHGDWSFRVTQYGQSARFVFTDWRNFALIDNDINRAVIFEKLSS